MFASQGARILLGFFRRVAVLDLRRRDPKQRFAERRFVGVRLVLTRGLNELLAVGSRVGFSVFFHSASLADLLACRSPLRFQAWTRHTRARSRSFLLFDVTISIAPK